MKKVMKMSKLKLKDVNRIAFSAALMVVCAWVAIPGPVPFTLQTFGLFMTAGLLGGTKGFVAMLVYVLLGTIGMPVFSGGRGGLGIILGETGGYIIGFLPAVFVGGILCKKNRKSTYNICLSMICCLIVCYTVGALWAYFMFFSADPIGGLISVLSKHILSFVVPDCIKMILAVFLIKKLAKYGI